MAEALGEDPVLSKIGVISRTRAGKIKKRVILDTRESFLRWASEKGQRVLLPHLLEAIMQILELPSVPDSSEEFGISAMVLDFAEAFWQIPFHPMERKLFCDVLEMNGVRKFLMCVRTVQGSEGAPLTWARTVALVMRLNLRCFHQTRCASSVSLMTRTSRSEALRQFENL